MTHTLRFWIYHMHVPNGNENQSSGGEERGRKRVGHTDRKEQREAGASTFLLAFLFLLECLWGFLLPLAFYDLLLIFPGHFCFCFNKVKVILLLVTKIVMKKTLGKVKFRALADILRTSFHRIIGKWREAVQLMIRKTRRQKMVR